MTTDIGKQWFSTTPSIGSRYRLDLARAATSRELKTDSPPSLVLLPPQFLAPVDRGNALSIGPSLKMESLADNFAGAGTTLLAARQNGLSSLKDSICHRWRLTLPTPRLLATIPIQLRLGLRTVLTTNLKDAPQVPEALVKGIHRGRTSGRSYSLLSSYPKTTAQQIGSFS